MISIALLLLLQSATSTPMIVIRWKGCTIQVPSSWKILNNTAANPTATIDLTLDEVGDGSTSIMLEKGLGGTFALNSSNLKILESLGQGETARYLAVAPPGAQAACRAQLNVRGKLNFSTAQRLARGLKRDP